MLNKSALILKQNAIFSVFSFISQSELKHSHSHVRPNCSHAVELAAGEGPVNDCQVCFVEPTMEI